MGDLQIQFGKGGGTLRSSSVNCVLVSVLASTTLLDRPCLVICLW